MKTEKQLRTWWVWFNQMRTRVLTENDFNEHNQEFKGQCIRVIAHDDYQACEKLRDEVSQKYSELVDKYVRLTDKYLDVKAQCDKLAEALKKVTSFPNDFNWSAKEALAAYNKFKEEVGNE